MGTSLLNLLKRLSSRLLESGRKDPQLDQDCRHAQHTVEGAIQKLEDGIAADTPTLSFLFAPEGHLQDIASACGWEDEYEELADEFDSLLDAA